MNQAVEYNSGVERIRDHLVNRAGVEDLYKVIQHDAIRALIDADPGQAQDMAGIFYLVLDVCRLMVAKDAYARGYPVHDKQTVTRTCTQRIVPSFCSIISECDNFRGWTFTVLYFLQHLESGGNVIHVRSGGATDVSQLPKSDQSQIYVTNVCAVLYFFLLERLRRIRIKGLSRHQDKLELDQWMFVACVQFYKCRSSIRNVAKRVPQFEKVNMVMNLTSTRTIDALKKIPPVQMNYEWEEYFSEDAVDKISRIVVAKCLNHKGNHMALDRDTYRPTCRSAIETITKMYTLLSVESVFKKAMRSCVQLIRVCVPVAGTMLLLKEGYNAIGGSIIGMTIGTELLIRYAFSGDGKTSGEEAIILEQLKFEDEALAELKPEIIYRKDKGEYSLYIPFPTLPDDIRRALEMAVQKIMQQQQQGGAIRRRIGGSSKGSVAAAVVSKGILNGLSNKYAKIPLPKNLSAAFDRRVAINSKTGLRMVPMSLANFKNFRGGAPVENDDSEEASGEYFRFEGADVFRSNGAIKFENGVLHVPQPQILVEVMEEVASSGDIDVLEVQTAKIEFLDVPAPAVTAEPASVVIKAHLIPEERVAVLLGDAEKENGGDTAGATSSNVSMDTFQRALMLLKENDKCSSRNHKIRSLATNKTRSIGTCKANNAAIATKTIVLKQGVFHHLAFTAGIEGSGARDFLPGRAVSFSFSCLVELTTSGEIDSTGSSIKSSIKVADILIVAKKKLHHVAGMNKRGHMFATFFG
ncbi:hypothetical protein HDU81_008586 [Chytriomyces hyalinus]|nr:hypothetical protein HDU81_008586 [Chytriomyces hyalinus]